MSAPLPVDPCAKYRDATGTLQVGTMIDDAIGIVTCVAGEVRTLTGANGTALTQRLTVALEHLKFIADFNAAAKQWVTKVK
jgi:hypothetical protein